MNEQLVDHIDKDVVKVQASHVTQTMCHYGLIRVTQFTNLAKHPADQLAY